MTTHDDTAATAHPYEETGQAAPGSAVAQIERFTDAELEVLLSPHTITPAQWIRTLLTNQEMPESDPEEMALGMMAQILMAGTSGEALSALDVDRAKELCGGQPGGRSPALEIHGARSLKSDFAEGAACYCIIYATRLDTGERIRITTGARAVQMMVAKHLYEGWLPFRAALEIRRERTKAGYHPLNMVGGI